MSLFSISISGISLVGNCGYATCEFDERDVVKQEDFYPYTRIYNVSVKHNKF